jgi:Bacteroidetes VLRF1 release factor
LRRYGEQALRDVGICTLILASYSQIVQDIRNLLQDWADEINGCERIWIRASGSNRKIFLDYDGAVILKGKDSTSVVVMYILRWYLKVTKGFALSHSRLAVLCVPLSCCLLDFLTAFDRLNLSFPVVYSNLRRSKFRI